MNKRCALKLYGLEMKPIFDVLALVPAAVRTAETIEV
jgi:hypothetical protein